MSTQNDSQDNYFPPQQKHVLDGLTPDERQEYYLKEIIRVQQKMLDELIDIRKMLWRKQNAY